MPSRSGRAAAAAGAVLALLLAGCGGVPHGGDPVPVREVPPGPALDDPDIRVLPFGPREGQSPDDVVRGWFKASASADGRHAVARRFLTAKASAGWDDAASTTVVQGDGLNVTVTGGRSARVRVRRVAVLDRDGSYRPAPGVVDLTLALRREDDAWRIDGLPDGVLVGDADFGRVYRVVDLYFLAPTGRRLVPDRRYLPYRLPSLPAAMIRALVAGPSKWLAPAVRTGFPDGTQVRSVVVDDGELVVDLSSQALRVNRSARADLSAQVVHTARQLSITGVRLQSEGRPYDVPGVGRRQRRDAWAEYDASGLSSSAQGYYLTSEGELRTLPGDPLPGPAGTTLRLESAAVSPDGRRLAAVERGDRSVALLLGDPAGALAARGSAGSLTPPSWGSGGRGAWTVAEGRRVWLVAAAAESTGDIAGGAGAREVVPAPGLPADVRRFAVSRDGARVAIVAGSPGVLYVARIADRSGRLSVEAPRRVGAGSLGDVRDVAWRDANDLAVLATGGARDASGVVVPWTVASDGSGASVLATTGLRGAPTAIAAAPDRPLLAVSAGQLYQLTGSSWGLVPAQGQSPVARPLYPG